MGKFVFCLSIYRGRNTGKLKQGGERGNVTLLKCVSGRNGERIDEPSNKRKPSICKLHKVAVSKLRCYATSNMKCT